MENSYLDWLVKLDERIVAAARDIKVLSKLTWPAELRENFLHGLHTGQLQLPCPVYAKTDLAANRAALASCIAELERASHSDEEPLHKYLLDTAN
ncbi:MAG: hypothetical protein WBN40_02560 [Pseudomonadales bacterium]